MTQKNEIRFGNNAQVAGSQFAVGERARASAGNVQAGVPSAPSDLDELRNALRDLVAELRAGHPDVDDAPSLAAIAESAQQEAHKPRPSKAVLAGLLDALMAGVAKATTLAGAVATIQHAVSVLL